MSTTFISLQVSALTLILALAFVTSNNNDKTHLNHQQATQAICMSEEIDNSQIMTKCHQSEQTNNTEFLCTASIDNGGQCWTEVK